MAGHVPGNCSFLFYGFNNLRPMSTSLLSRYLLPEFCYLILVKGIRVYVLKSSFCEQSSRRMLDESLAVRKLDTNHQGLDFASTSSSKDTRGLNSQFITKRTSFPSKSKKIAFRGQVLRCPSISSLALFEIETRMR